MDDTRTFTLSGRRITQRWDGLSWTTIADEAITPAREETTMNVDLTGSACTDCIMLIANGETPPEMNEDETAAWVAEFERRTAGYNVVMACDEDREGEFSWRSCDTCGSPLGGDRHPVAFLSR